MGSPMRMLEAAAACFVLALVSCSGKEAGERVQAGGGGGKKTVYTDNYPVAWFAERLSGELATVVFPAPKQGDPAFWRPSEEAIREYQKADLVLQNGATFAKWAEQASLPASKVVDTSLPFKDRFIPLADSVTHVHGPDGAHAHGSIDFNTWLDPQLAAIQAGEAARGLARLLPAHSETIEKNLKALKADLDALDSGFKALVEGYQNEPILASHPVYSYLARRYGWNLQSMHWEPGEAPPEEDWAKLKELMTGHAAKWMIWEDEPSPAVAARLQEEFKVRSAVFQPCGNRPASGDYLSVMKKNIENLKPVFARG